MILCSNNPYFRVVLRNNVHFKSNSHPAIRHIQSEISTPMNLQCSSIRRVLLRRHNIDEKKRNKANIRWYSTVRKNNYLKEDGTFGVEGQEQIDIDAETGHTTTDANDVVDIANDYTLDDETSNDVADENTDDDE